MPNHGRADGKGGYFRGNFINYPIKGYCFDGTRFGNEECGERKYFISIKLALRYQITAFVKGANFAAKEWVSIRAGLKEEEPAVKAYVSGKLPHHGKLYRLIGLDEPVDIIRAENSWVKKKGCRNGALEGDAYENA